MSEHLQPGWRAAALLALLSVACTLAAGLALSLRPAPIRSHDDQIAFVLRERNIPYTQITLGERWPDHINFQYGSNVFPGMKVDWGTYPNHLGHTDFPGCFRCHDDLHTTAEGETISQDCFTCHTLLAMDEENPEVLQTLRP